MHNGEGGAVVGLCFARTAAQSPAIDLGDHIKDRRNEESDQRQLPIDSRSDVKHSGERQARFDERNQVIDGDRLDRSRIGLHAIERVHGALGVVIGQGQALNLTEKLRSEPQQKFFAGIRLKHRYGQILQLRQDGYDDQQRRGEHQCRCGRHGSGGGPQRPNQARKRMRTQSAVHGDLER